jgi:Fe-S-cluster containining protein
MEHSYDEIDRIFIQDGYNLANEIMGKDYSDEKRIILTRTLYELIDNLLESFTSRLQKDFQSLACKKGCSWCCTQPVFTNEWELEYLKYFMRKRFTGDRLVEIKDKAKMKNDEVAGLPAHEQLLKRIPCPLLHENICSVYPARPMACRIYLSSDVDSCIDEFRNPSNEKNFAKLYDFPLHAGRKMNEGIAKWFEEKGFEIKEIRLEEGISE